MKFISIIDFYSRNVNGMLDKQNYHLLPIKAAEELGYETELWILDPDHPNTEIPENLKVKRVGHGAKYLYRLLKENDALIYANTRILRTMVACFFGNKTIFMNHTTEKPKKHSFAIKQLMKNFDKIRAVSEEEKQNLLELGIREDKIQIIPHTLDTEFWRKGKRDKDLDVVTVANVRELKNIDIIEKACRKLGLKLIVVGENMSNQDIEVTGKKNPEEIRDYLQRAKVYVNSSDSEGLCLSVYEAIAAGLPVCLPNISTFKNINALFHEPKDIDKLAENIKKQIDNPIYHQIPDHMKYDNVLDQFKNLIKAMEV
ncbi:glycosyltransferase family 4 protein [Candidatus Woesearchaeota archaeon]|nr:glycosyltransferase family 4 protein [Candidatus Woesearchaeota archaeon]